MLPSSSSLLPFLPSSRFTHVPSLRFSPPAGGQRPPVAAGLDLGNDAFLAKIDRLRATNVGALVPLPQVIVVGDQSSGKSSALESLTGFAFPRAATLCTRYATQISCIRAPAPPRTVVSIIPRPGADEALRARLQAFRHELGAMDDLALAQVFHKANVAMGIRMDHHAPGDGLSAFSEDILTVDLYGPDQTHLTLIDVPGIFRIPTPGLTTDSDIQLVRNMVQRYMANERTIILAVIPCNVDIANQEILRLAAEADPRGLRTMGVLTKPDLATERATQDAVLALVRGERNALQLGYCVLRNRGADDHASAAASAEARRAAEAAFFAAPPWSEALGSGHAALGTDALRARLRGLVRDISQRALPHVRADVAARRRACAAQLAALGAPRADEAAQRQHLVALAARAQDVTKSALHGFYAGDDGALFARHPALRLITRVTRLNEQFADTFWRRGHVQEFRGEDKTSSTTATTTPAAVAGWPFGGVGQDDRGSKSDDDDNDDGERDDDDDGDDASDYADFDADEELGDSIALDYTCPRPRRGPLTGLIRDVYLASRGPELGTFSGTVLACVFARLTDKWEPLVLAHAGQAIVLVHAFLRALLAALCPDAAARARLWDGLLRDGLRDRYRAALAHARFLLRVERHGLPLTLNASFHAVVQKRRHARLVDRVTRQAQDQAATFPLPSGGQPPGGQPPAAAALVAAAAASLRAVPPDTDDTARVCADLLDTVESYYAVARKRFVDTLCQHVVHHLLLFGPDSPLALLAPARILPLDADQLDAIAGEDAVTRNQRRVLGGQLASLDAAMAVLRS